MTHAEKTCARPHSISSWLNIQLKESVPKDDSKLG